MSSRCLQPVLVLQHGEWRHFSCRRCRNCIKGRKSDYVGRMCLETRQAAHTLFATVTYASGEPGADKFVVRDTQLFMKRLRQKYARDARRNGFVGEVIQTPPRKIAKRREDVSERTLKDRARRDAFIGPPKPRRKQARLRFIRVGERGTNGTRRCHWHFLLWADGPKPDWQRSKETHKNQVWDMWPQGWSDVSHVQSDQPVRTANYVGKYIIKSAFDEAACVGFSSRPALGAQGMAEIARRAAVAGLPLRETYTLPNVLMTRGEHAGKHRKFRMCGAARDAAFKAYREKWIEINGSDQDIPETEWSLNYDEDAVFVRPPATPKMDWHKRQRKLRPIGRGLKSGTLFIRDHYGTFLGVLSISARGAARFAPANGSGNYVVRKDLRGILDMPDADHEIFSKWLADHRGPNWMAYDEYVAERAKVLRAHNEALARREQQGHAAVHDPAYFKARDVAATVGFSISAAKYVRAKGVRNVHVKPEDYLARRQFWPKSPADDDPKGGGP